MLADDLKRYVALHRALGFKFRVQAGLLRSFVVFAETYGDSVVLAARTIAWASEAPSPAQRRNRLLTVRRFALAMHAEDTRHELPATDVFGTDRHARVLPHIWTADEIALLMSATALLGQPGAIRPLMYRTLFGLLAATGLRISEALALALRVRDVGEHGLIILATKFRKNRLVPIHATTRRALDAWLRTFPGRPEDPLFRSSAGTGPAYSTVIAVFLRLTRTVGLRGAAGEPGPRIHDRRHSFAVRSLQQCGSDRAAVARHMAGLSTYLGHAHVTDTYWYLQATPTLMSGIAEAGEALHRGDAS
jgi:integrase